MKVKKSVKVQILTLLPMSWSIKKIENEFKASNYMVRKAKCLVKSGGILSTPNPSQGHGLCNDTRVLVQNFYESDEISRVMPGKKDCVSQKNFSSEKVTFRKSKRSLPAI